MRIALVTEFYYPTVGGIQEHVFHFARQARRAGHSVTIVTASVRDLPPASSETEHDVIHIGRSIPVESNGSVGRVAFGLDLGRRLRRLLTAERFDLVHVHSPLCPVLPMLAVRNSSVPVVGTYHTNFARSLRMQLLRRQCQAIVDGIDVNIAVSEACIRAVRPYVNGEFRIIPNGVDCGEWSGGHRMSWARDQLNVLFIGRLEARNGLDRVLRAWPLLPKGLRANLLVLGDGPVRRQYETLAHELGVPARFFGSIREHRADYFASADVLVCPMTIASFGVTLLEGMAAGLPIIASDIDGFREILTHGREGWLIDSADASLFAARLSELLESPSLRSRLGDAGQRTAQRYDWPRVTEQILDVYREVGARA